MKEFMHLQPFLKMYRFKIIKLHCLVIREKNSLFTSVVPLKSHNTLSYLYSAETQLNLKSTVLCHLWAHCVNINVWEHSTYNQLAIPPATHIPTDSTLLAGKQQVRNLLKTETALGSHWHHSEIKHWLLFAHLLLGCIFQNKTKV